jgi:ATP-binding cassette subfamily B protein
MTSYQFMKKVISYRPMLYMSNVLFWGLFILTPIAIGVVTKKFFDTLSGNLSGSTEVWYIILLFFCLGLARVVFYFLGTLTHLYQDFILQGLLRKNILEYTLSEPGATSLAYPHGELISRYRDDVEMSTHLIGNSMLLPGYFLFACGAFYLLFSIDCLITLSVFIPLLLILMILNFVRIKLQRYRKESQEASAQVVGFMGEVFGSVKAIKIATAENHVIQQFHKLNDRRRKLVLRDSLFTKVIETLFSNITQIGTGIILLVVATSIHNGVFTIGDFSLFAYFLPLIGEVVDEFGQFLTRYKLTEVSLKRLAAIIQNGPPEVFVQHHPLPLKEGGDPFLQKKRNVPSLDTYTIERVGYQYSDSNKGIHNISLQINKGTFTVITGRTGSGKTTLLRCILGLFPIQSGHLRWNGHIIGNAESFFTPPVSSYTPQVPQLFSGTIKENILLDVPFEKELFNRTIRSTVLAEDLKQFEHGWDTFIGSHGVKLSGGQKQRTAMARMFLRSCQIYALDDVTSALDIETEKKLWEKIFQMKEKTFIVVSHTKEVMKQADQVIVLKDGEIEAIGKLEDVLDESDEMQKIWNQ